MERRGREAELLKLQHESVETNAEHEKQGSSIIHFMYSLIDGESKDMKPPFGNVW